jgi:hypothetical protein
LIYLVSDDAKPIITKTEDYAKSSYKEAADGLNSKGLPVPINPFDGH